MTYLFAFIILRALKLPAVEIPLADGGSLTTGPSADNRAGFELGRLPRARWRICEYQTDIIVIRTLSDATSSASLAHIIVYSMAPDGIPTPSSNAPTPFLTPLPSGMNTPHIQTSTLGDYLSAPLGRSNVQSKNRTYLAGSKALDSLARLIASTESFFHPSNSGTWTEDVCATNHCYLQFLEDLRSLIVTFHSSAPSSNTSCTTSTNVFHSYFIRRDSV